MDDASAYNKAVRALILEPVQGPNGTYHVKNGQILHGYTLVNVNGFATSEHYWNIFH